MDNIFPTNTLACASFDILTFDGVEDPLISVNKLATLDSQESYFETAVKFINESNNEYTESKKILYKSIAEAQTTVVVLESFSDFFVKVKEIIDKFLKFIKSLFQRFLTTLSRLIGSETYLKKHKKDLSNFREGDNFDFDGFNYTFSESIPLPEAALEFNNSLFDTLITNSNGNLTTASVMATIAAMDLEEDYATFRANVIGKTNEKIYMSDFSDELFEIYRDGCSDVENIEVDSSYIRLATERFFDYEKTKKNVDRAYKRVEDAYKRVQSQVQDIVRRNGDLNAKAFMDRLPDSMGITQIADRSPNEGLKMSGELMTQLDIYVKAKVDQIQEYSNIHALAFAAKLDALKECNRQDKNTLYIALSRIQRTDSKRKV